MPISRSFNTKIRLTMFFAMFKWFWTVFALGAPEYLFLRADILQKTVVGCSWVLSLLIHSDQMGFIEGTCFGKNDWVLINRTLGNTLKPGILLFIDFQGIWHYWMKFYS